MNEQGLAMYAQQQQGQINQDMVRQVAEMLMQGMSPEELVQRGVPVEVVEMAMQIVSQQATGPQMPADQEGLAGMVVQGMM